MCHHLLVVLGIPFVFLFLYCTYRRAWRERFHFDSFDRVLLMTLACEIGRAPSSKLRRRLLRMVLLK